MTRKALAKAAFLDEIRQVFEDDKVPVASRLTAMKLYAKCRRYDEHKPQVRAPKVPSDPIAALEWRLADLRKRIKQSDGNAYAKMILAERELLTEIREAKLAARLELQDEETLAALSPEEQREWVREKFSKLPDGLLLPIWEICVERGFGT